MFEADPNQLLELTGSDGSVALLVDALSDNSVWYMNDGCCWHDIWL